MPRVTLDDPDGTLFMLRESVAQFAAQHDGGRILRNKREHAADLDTTVWAVMAQAGWTGLLLPEALGGPGLGMREQAVVSEALGRALITEPVASASVVSSVLIADAPASEECRRLAEGIVDGRLIVAPAWQDSTGGQRTAGSAPCSADPVKMARYASSFWLAATATCSKSGAANGVLPNASLSSTGSKSSPFPRRRRMRASATASRSAAPFRGTRSTSF